MVIQHKICQLGEGFSLENKQNTNICDQQRLRRGGGGRLQGGGWCHRRALIRARGRETSCTVRGKCQRAEGFLLMGGVRGHFLLGNDIDLRSRRVSRLPPTGPAVSPFPALTWWRAQICFHQRPASPSGGLGLVPVRHRSTVPKTQGGFLPGPFSLWNVTKRVSLDSFSNTWEHSDTSIFR